MCWLKRRHYALTFPHFATALAFFIDWKEQRYAARLVLERSAESDGNAHFLLDPAQALGRQASGRGHPPSPGHD
jgi:uncharacterized protein DUF6880